MADDPTELPELGAWRLAARMTGAIDEDRSGRKTTPEDVLRLVSKLRDWLHDSQTKLVMALEACPDHPDDVAKRRDTLSDLSMRQLNTIDGLRKVLDETRERLHATEAARCDIREERDSLRERLRAAEAVRDDARAASQRYLDEKREIAALYGLASHER